MNSRIGLQTINSNAVASECGKGKTYPSEKSIMQDKETGITICQMTNYPANHSNLYYTKTSFTPDGKKVVILSCRTGYSNLYAVSVDSGEIVQLTDHKEDIEQLSPCISSNGECVYYSLGNSIRSVNLLTLKESTLIEFPNSYPGTLSISREGRFVVTRLSTGTANVRGKIKQLVNWLKSPLCSEASILNISCNLLKAILSRFNFVQKYDVVLVSTDNPGAVDYIKELSYGGITLLSPDNKHILCHKSEQEIWCCHIDGKSYRHLYGHGTGKWITHPNWLSNNEIIVANWPNGLVGISLNGDVRQISKFNSWHPTVSSDGSLIACDTMLPDTGIYAINPDSGETRVLFHPESAVQKQWAKSSPPKRLSFMPFSIKDQFGSQWQHPHPSFSPNGKKIIFNSTRGGGHSQVFIAFLEGIIE